jgi:transketolase
MRTRPGKGVARLEARQKAHFIEVGPTEWETIGRELEEENA